MKTILFKNCRLISPDTDLNGASVLTADGRIRRIYCCGDKLPTADQTIDLNGAMLLPGFVDVHFHGRSGADFCDASPDGFATIARGKLSEGVTSILPSTSTLDEATLAASMKTAAQYVKDGEKYCRVPGIHLEGPYINPKCLGAQNPAFVRKPDVEEVRRLNAIFPVKKISYAVEMDDTDEFASEMIAEGVVPSCVHSNAGFKRFLKAYDHGLRNLSHFCNQITPLHHREIGLVGAGLLCDDVNIELICDKLHVCEDMIALVFSVKNIENIQLITDSVRASGMPDGDYSLGGLDIVMKDGQVRLKSNGALAGSSLSYNVGLRNVFEITGLDLCDLVKTTSWNQARILNIPDVGRIEPGYLADFAVLDEDFNVKATYVGGECRYQA